MYSVEDSAGWCDMSKSKNMSQCDCVAADCSFAVCWHVLAHVGSSRRDLLGLQLHSPEGRFVLPWWK